MTFILCPRGAFCSATVLRITKPFFENRNSTSQERRGQGRDRSVDPELESSIRVRQGSCEGPVVFPVLIQAALETVTWPVPNP
jgi:hypothetical protein